MDYKWITDMKDFENIREEWDRAIIASNLDNPFLLSDILMCWWNYYGASKRLMILACFENTVLSAGLPLYIETAGIKRGKINYMWYVGGSAANHTEPFFQEGCFGRFQETLLLALNKKDWDILILPKSRENVAKLFGEANYDILRVEIKQDGSEGLIRTNTDVDSYLQMIPKRLRRYVRNCRAAIQKTREVALEQIEHDKVTEMYELYVKFSKESFLDRRQNSAFEDVRNIQFFRNLLLRLSERGFLEAHILRFGNQVAAISFAYRFGKGFKWILTAYNYQFKEFRPGHILIYELLKTSLEKGDPYFNMYYGGDSYYKSQWCNSFDPLYKISIFNQTLKGKAAHMAYRLKNLQ